MLIRFDNHESRILRISAIRWIINGADFMNEFFYWCLQYLKECVWSSSITNLNLFFFLLQNLSVVIFYLVSMTQGQLVGKGGGSLKRGRRGSQTAEDLCSTF